MGEEAIRQALPVTFNWPLFLLALALMAVPIVEMGWQMRRQPVNKQVTLQA